MYVFSNEPDLRRRVRLRSLLYLRMIAAFRAQAFDAQRVLRGQEFVFGGDVFLYGFEFGGEKFDVRAALRADHVIVPLVFIAVLVARAPVAEAYFARESRFREKFERAVNGCLPDRRVFALHKAVQVFARHVLFGAQKNVQDQIALRGAFEACALKVFVKYFVLFSHRYSYPCWS